jgi:hypothetical protein
MAEVIRVGNGNRWVLEASVPCRAFCHFPLLRPLSTCFKNMLASYVHEPAVSLRHCAGGVSGEGDEVHRVCSPVPLLYIQTAPHRTPFRLEAHWSATCRALRLLSFPPSLPACFGRLLDKAARIGRKPRAYCSGRRQLPHATGQPFDSLSAAALYYAPYASPFAGLSAAALCHAPYASAASWSRPPALE